MLWCYNFCIAVSVTLQSCEVAVVQYMANQQGEGLPLSEIYEEVSKELRVPLGNMSRWWRNKEKSSRHLSDVDASQCIAVLSPSQSCCHSLWFASLMLHSALLFCDPLNLAVMVYGLKLWFNHQSSVIIHQSASIIIRIGDR